MKTYALVVTEVDIRMLSAALTALPYRDVADLVARLDAQLESQKRLQTDPVAQERPPPVTPSLPRAARKEGP